MFDFEDQQDANSSRTASHPNSNLNSRSNSIKLRNQRISIALTGTGTETGTGTGTEQTSGTGSKSSIPPTELQKLFGGCHNIISKEGEEEGEVEINVESVGLRWRSGICSRLGPRSSNEDRSIAISDLLDAVKIAKERERERERREDRGKEGVTETAAIVKIEAVMEIGINQENEIEKGWEATTGIVIGIQETGTKTKTRTDVGSGIEIGIGTGIEIENEKDIFSDLRNCSGTYSRDSVCSGSGSGSGSVSVSASMSVWQAVCSTSCITFNTADFYIAPGRERDIEREREVEAEIKSDKQGHGQGGEVFQRLLIESEDIVEKEYEREEERERQGYFAVYDGHCGAEAAIHLQETLHFSIFHHPLYHTDMQTAIIESCVATDKEFLAQSRDRKQYSGTTALGAIVKGNELTVFNIGDCHAVLCCNGIAHDMSDPHKPNRPDEAARILAAKGWITEEKELYMARLHRMDLSDPVVRDKAQLVSWVTIYRVCGEISVSRSIGDPDYKTVQPGERVDAFFLWPDGHDQVLYCTVLYCTVILCSMI